MNLYNVLKFWLFSSTIASIHGAHEGKNHTLSHMEDLEHLAYKYGTDKSKDDHKYVDIYASLFNPRRHSTESLLEIGIAAGQSLQMWNEYFPRAMIYGVDINRPAANVAENLAKLPRVRLLFGDSTKEGEVNNFHLPAEGFDIIIDDGNHKSWFQESTLRNFWKFVKPGGHYIMEDVDAQLGGFDFSETPHFLANSTRDIFEANHVSFVDAHVGHRAWKDWLRTATSVSAKDHRIHNSYLVILRKRIGLVPPIRINSGIVAMNPGKVVSP